MPQRKCVNCGNPTHINGKAISKAKREGLADKWLCCPCYLVGEIEGKLPDPTRITRTGALVTVSGYEGTWEP